MKDNKSTPEHSMNSATAQENDGKRDNMTSNLQDLL